MGRIFDIQKFCVNDGPGIRTTIFLKGCPLKCKWCHNPESNSINKQLFYLSEKCKGCKACAAACENDVHQFINNQHIVNYDLCMTCGKCVDICPSNALGFFGIEKSVDEIMNIVLKDIKYYEQSNGGVTISGGEPMLQFEYVYEIVKRCKEEKLNVCIETSGFALKENFIKINEYVDMFLFDYKATGMEEHKRLVGVDNSIILENLNGLLLMNSKVILRCPIIPGYNLNENHLKKVAELSRMQNIIQVDILLSITTYGVSTVNN
jgi:pyruvate formate lyase activating enzyme